jgi:hypothetical protein
MASSKSSSSGISFFCRLKADDDAEQLPHMLGGGAVLMTKRTAHEAGGVHLTLRRTTPVST